MREPAEPEKHPQGVLRFNRLITSRAFTYLVAGLFVLDVIPRLMDGRTGRGIGNLFAAAFILLMRGRTRRAALGETAPNESRERWAAERPIITALGVGAAWGLAMSIFLIATKEGSILLALVLGLGGGLLLFGPMTMLLSRRYRNRNAR